MNSILKNEIMKSFRAGSSVKSIAAYYGFPEDHIKRLVNPPSPPRIISTVIKRVLIVKKSGDKSLNRKLAVEKLAQATKLLDEAILLIKNSDLDEKDPPKTGKSIQEADTR
jgi:hypothetical protein